MPNGGSDCCGTCWFNAKNKGEAAAIPELERILALPWPEHEGFVEAVRERVVEAAVVSYGESDPGIRRLVDDFSRDGVSSIGTLWRTFITRGS